MKGIEIEKVTLNIGTGEPGEKLEKAIKLLNALTNEKPIATKAKSRIPTWGIRPGLNIGCKVTLRKEKAKIVLGRLLKGVNNKLTPRKFDKFGNFSFGIKDYVEIPEAKYYPDIGVIGLEVAVTLKRPGYRVKERMLKTSKIGKKHMIAKDDAIKFVVETFGTEVTD